MRCRELIPGFLLLAMMAGIGNAWAQAEQTPESLLDETEAEVVEEAPVAEPVEVPAETPSSNVTDVNEENFRRSMELRDRNLQRSPDLTTGSYSPSTAQQVLQKLPEESQKHLREQLREVIVENGPWSPEEAGTEYPYVPSTQAEKNPPLERREEAAWGEMVSEYHEREAAIHANAARIQAATATAGNPGQNVAGQNAMGESGASQQGQESESSNESGESGEESERAEQAEALAEMPDASEAENSASESADIPREEAGTEQNALELLTQRNQVPAQASSESSDSESASIEINQATSQSQDQSSGQETQDLSAGFSSDDVIAIEDLDKVRVDPQDTDDN